MASKNPTKVHHELVPAPEPKTELGRYRILAKSASIPVSPLCLGGMSLGTAHSDFMGSVDQEQAYKILDAFVDAGGNFIDTASNYQDEESEKLIGSWMEARGNRDLVVLATKFSSNYRAWELGKGRTVMYNGNHRKSMFLSVDASLRKLRTTYIDLLYVHWWDWLTSVEELMDGLHVLVEQGKVLYLGASDMPAWFVGAANTYARERGKTPFSVYQGRWNVMRRDFEREIINMANHFGMSLVPWDVVGGGRLQSRAQLEAKDRAGEGLRSFWATGQTETERKASEVLEKVATEVGAESVQQVALAYVRHKARHVIPIVGGRKVEHLEQNIAALKIKLTEEQIKTIESFQDFDVGFPLDLMGDDPLETGKTPWGLALTAHYDFAVRR